MGAAIVDQKRVTPMMIGQRQQRYSHLWSSPLAFLGRLAGETSFNRIASLGGPSLSGRISAGQIDSSTKIDRPARQHAGQHIVLADVVVPQSSKRVNERDHKNGFRQIAVRLLQGARHIPADGDAERRSNLEQSKIYRATARKGRGKTGTQKFLGPRTPETCSVTST